MDESASFDQIVFEDGNNIAKLESTVSLSHSKQTIQLIQDFPINNHIDPQNYTLNLKSILIQLTKNYNISFENKQIFFYLQQSDLYMNCGIEPITKDIKIQQQDYIHNADGIKIKIKKIKTFSILHRIMAIQNPVQNVQEKPAEQFQQGGKSRRTKQRRIGYIIQKVIEWRKYYSGTSDHNSHLKLSLEDAAKEVKISKKSLDDYLFQIRFGNRYAFNFNQHYNDKVGVLRDFVRQKRKIKKSKLKLKRKINISDLSSFIKNNRIL